ncbi:aldehyde dehydrogenase family protein [Polycladomyces subterraneus]|uniref:Aldehyde dehydrogenase family protein n=1 Tax=Polycladomyces subterraneus TaxID=1016997 RepID=A0ABT8IP07_9BACL|nr:aldehyde dehydrogenase family protein [Polycladomyces subterraneus]MDN4594499.1 aldehyde dehydrogenase family protein [Polycladomyces subterraneus]
MFIDGKWAKSENGAFYEVTNPATGEVVGTVADATANDVKKAIDAAYRVYQSDVVVEGCRPN